MSKLKRLDKNSVTKQVENFTSVYEDVLPPNGVELKTELEKVIWKQFSRTRLKSDWRDIDLILLHKIVKLEVNIREYQDELDEQGAILDNRRGTPVANPLVSVIDTISRRQLKIIGSINLNQTASDPRTINVLPNKKNETDKLKEDSLLAMPE